MGDDARYEVALDLRTTDNMTSGMATALGGAHQLARSFEGVLDSVVSMGARIGLMAGGLGMGLLVHQAQAVSDRMESAQIGIASLLKVGGAAADFKDGMSQSSKLMTQISQDAAKLPGETEDLITIFQAGLGPGMRAGMNPDQVRAMSSDMMAFGIGVAHLQGDMVAREMASLMERGATMHNVLGMKLGLVGGEATKFNAMDATHKAAELTRRAGEHHAAIDAFSKSYQGLSTTFKDALVGKDGFFTQAWGPVFERIKGTLGELNAWFAANQGTVTAWANSIGRKLAHAFDVGKSAFQHWLPILETFGERAWDRMLLVWNEVEPIIARVAGYIEAMMRDPATFDKIGTALKGYAALKVGTAVVPGLGKAGVGAMAALAEVAGLGEAALFAAPIVLTLSGAVLALADSSSQYHAEAVEHATNIGKAADKAADALGGSGGAGLVGTLENIGTHWLAFADTMATGYAKIVATLADGFRTITGGNGGRAKLFGGDEAWGKVDRARESDIRAGGSPYGRPGGGVALGLAAQDLEAKKPPGNKGVAPTIKVDKIELVVTSNQDPLRIAESVVTKLRTIDKHPSVSRINFGQRL